MSLSKLFLAGKNFRESLISDIPAGDGKMADLFFTVLGYSLVALWGGSPGITLSFAHLISHMDHIK